MAHKKSTYLRSTSDEKSSYHARTVSELVYREIGLDESRDVVILMREDDDGTRPKAPVARLGTTPASTRTLPRCVGVVCEARRAKKKRNNGTDDRFVWRRGGWRVSGAPFGVCRVS